MKICDKLDCTGCSACFNACRSKAITMESDFEGFLYPTVDEGKCTHCGLCSKACPIGHELMYKNPVAIAPLAVMAKSEEIRCQSSSGGVFNVVARYVLRRGGIVVGATMDQKSKHVYHKIIETEEELPSILGSKYVQSEISDTYRNVKKQIISSKLVLFSGTPCQIVGLKSYIGALADSPLLITIDLICHGVPSQRMFDAYMQGLSKKYGINQEKIRFRFRNPEGWNCCCSCESEEPLPMIKNSDLYTALFLQGALFRDCCYHCKLATNNRVGDITIGDFWGIGKKKTFKGDTSKGCSLVLVNSKKGKEWLRLLNNEFIIDERTWDEALSENRNLRRPSKRPLKRKIAAKWLLNYDYDLTYSIWVLTPFLRVKLFLAKCLLR